MGLIKREALSGVTLTGAGTPVTAVVGAYDIVPSAALGTGLSNYAITYNNGTLTVGQKALGITAKPDVKTYNGLAYSGGNGVIYSGFVNGEVEGVLGGGLVYGGSSQGAKNAGNYVITPSGLTSANYAISYFGGALGVIPAPLGIAANSATRF